MSTLIYPDYVQAHADREESFICRKTVFFALFALSFFFDLVDTLIKGTDYFCSLGFWYIGRSVVGIIIAIMVMITKNSRLLMWFGVAWFIVNILSIAMLLVSSGETVSTCPAQNYNLAPFQDRFLVDAVRPG